MLYIYIFAYMSLGPVPRNVAVFPAGCQSLRVTWTTQAPTPPLTLIQYLVNFREQGSSDPYQDSTLRPGSSYTITNLTPGTHYSVNVLAQTQLGYGNYCCSATASTYNGKAPSDQRHTVPASCHAYVQVHGLSICLSYTIAYFVEIHSGKLYAVYLQFVAAACIFMYFYHSYFSWTVHILQNVVLNYYSTVLVHANIPLLQLVPHI